jgi:hypothetical protein
MMRIFLDAIEHRKERIEVLGKIIGKKSRQIWHSWVY